MQRWWPECVRSGSVYGVDASASALHRRMTRSIRAYQARIYRSCLSLTLCRLHYSVEGTAATAGTVRGMFTVSVLFTNIKQASWRMNGASTGAARHHTITTMPISTVLFGCCLVPSVAVALLVSNEKEKEKSLLFFFFLRLLRIGGLYAPSVCARILLTFCFGRGRFCC